MPIECPHCGNRNYFPRGTECSHCGKDMAASAEAAKATLVELTIKKVDDAERFQKEVMDKINHIRAGVDFLVAVTIVGLVIAAVLLLYYLTR